jgi:diguanylate cyclase
LQGQALSLLENPAEPGPPGLLQRLFGGRESVEQMQTQAVETVHEAVCQAFQPVPVVPGIMAIAQEVPSPAIKTPVSVVSVVEPVSNPEPTDKKPLIEVHAVVPPLLEPDAPRTLLPLPVQQEELVTAPPPTVTASLEAFPAPLDVNPDELTHPVFSDSGHDAGSSLDSLPLGPALAAFDPERPEPDALYALPDSPEPSYSSVAKHIEDTLLGLLDDLSLPERHRPQAEAMRDRLQHGLNWYELLTILDDLAVLMLAITDSGQHEFEVYLKQLNERLESFQSNLQAASDGHADGRSAAREMDTRIREQVDGLQSSVQDAADLDSLKHVLENHLEGLLGTMDQHQKQRDQREQEVAGRLQGLAERVASMEQEAQGYREHLEEQRQKALIDPLTGLPNRAAWSERLDHEVARWQQHGNTLLLAMLDLDHFKRINDNYGHLAGDKVLKIIAGVLCKRLRGSDFIARFGGEEFVLLVPDTTLAAGAKLAETLRAAIEACPFHFKGERVTITVSMGMTAFKPGERSEWVLKRADQALYRAKNAGRNRVELG